MGNIYQHIYIRCSAEAGKLAEAIEFYSKHLEIRPNNSEVLFNRALNHTRLGDLEEALQVGGGWDHGQDLGRSREIDPTHLDTTQLIAQVLWSLGDKR